MQNQYDLIFRENLVEFFGPFIQRNLGIAIMSMEDIPNDLPRTVERRPDFLKLVETEAGERIILHLEVQTRNDPGMLDRMRVYHALLLERHKIPIVQGVLLLGRRNRMRSRARPEEVFSGFEVLEISSMDADDFLGSQILEEIILAVLADYQGRSAGEVVHSILTRILEVAGDDGNVQKAIEQLLIISNLRNLIDVVKMEIEIMPITFDFSKSSIYLEGKAEGKAEGIAEGKAEGLAEGKAEGKAEGLAEGKAEGLAEGKKEMAVAMLNAGKCSIEEISMISGLSREEVIAARNLNT